jgi:WD40 repeat protein
MELIVDEPSGGTVSVARFDAEGARFAVGSWGGGAVVYDAVDGDLLFEVDSEARVADLAFDATGNLFTGSREHGVRRWTSDGQPAGELERGLEPPFTGVGVARDGASAAIHDGGIVRTFDLASMREIPELTLIGQEGRMVISLSPGAEVLARGTLAGVIQLRRRGDVPRELRGHEAMLSAILYAPDGEELITGAYDGTIRFWEVVRPPAIVEVPDRPGYRVFDLSSDGRWVLYGSDEDLVVWDQQRKAELLRIDRQAEPRQLRGWIDRGSRHLITVDPGDSTTAMRGVVWGLPEGREVGSVPRAMLPEMSLVAAPDRFLTLFWEPNPENEDENIRGFEVYDLQTGELLNRFVTSDFVFTYAVSESKRLGAAGSSEGRVWIIDLDDGAVLRELSAQTGQISALGFSPDGSLLVSGSTRAMIQVWNTNTGELIDAVPSGAALGVADFAWSPDGRQLAAYAGAREVQIYDAARFERMLSIELEWSEHPPTLQFQPAAGTLHADFGTEVKVLGPAR